MFERPQCKFKQVTQNEVRDFTPRCSKGQECLFFQQNRCYYFHPGVGVQRPRIQNGQFGGQECRYKDDCWNLDTCTYVHPHQVFQFGQRMNGPPLGMRMRNMRMDY